MGKRGTYTNINDKQFCSPARKDLQVLKNLGGHI